MVVLGRANPSQPVATRRISGPGGVQGGQRRGQTTWEVPRIWEDEFVFDFWTLPDFLDRGLTFSDMLIALFEFRGWLARGSLARQPQSLAQQPLSLAQQELCRQQP